MSDEKQETIADIVAEMRGNEFDDPHLNADGIIGARRLAKGWADRIEAAAKRECGNAAAMREAIETALTTIRGVINGTISRTNNSVFDCRDKLKSALAGPPRNCDRFMTLSDAWDAYCSSNTMFIFPYWLFATTETKGESDGK